MVRADRLAASPPPIPYVNPIFAAAHEIQLWCEERGWRFCLIGGVAVQRWGEPRLTRDVDCTILTGLGTEASYIDELLGTYRARLDDARAFALANRVLLLLSRHDVPIDISLGALPVEERIVDRATRFSVAPNVDLLTCSAEDLLVLKAFAGRDRDWADIEGILLRQGRTLDLPLVFAELLPLLQLKDEPPDAHQRLQRMIDRLILS